jgi:hypothetical protein
VVVRIIPAQRNHEIRVPRKFSGRLRQ